MTSGIWSWAAKSGLLSSLGFGAPDFGAMIAGAIAFFIWWNHDSFRRWRSQDQDKLEALVPQLEAQMFKGDKPTIQTSHELFEHIKARMNLAVVLYKLKIPFPKLDDHQRWWMYSITVSACALNADLKAARRYASDQGYRLKWPDFPLDPFIPTD